MPSLPLPIVASLVLVGCFNPDLTKVAVRCDNDNPCPAGMSCVNSRCAQPNPADGSSGPADLSLADLAPGESSGCADKNGTYLGAAWACPGAFGGPNPSVFKRCATGFIPCTVAVGINLTACRTLSGFFVANYLGTNTSGSLVTCTPPTGGNRAVFGCGTGGATQQTTCGGFVQALICTSSPGWQCTDQFDQLRNTNTDSGVLCCKQ